MNNYTYVLCSPDEQNSKLIDENGQYLQGELTARQGAPFFIQNLLTFLRHSVNNYVPEQNCALCMCMVEERETGKLEVLMADLRLDISPACMYGNGDAARHQTRLEKRCIREYSGESGGESFFLRVSTCRILESA